MEPNQDTRLAAIEAKLAEIEKISRRTYQIFLWSAIVTVGAVVVPVILLALAIPTIMSTFSSAYSGLL